MTVRAIISRAEAKAAGLKRYFTGVPCKYGHVCDRNVASWGCVKCRVAGNQQWHKDNPFTTRSVAQKKKIRKKQMDRRRDNAAHVFELKRSMKCPKCGFDHPAALHFHHTRDKTTEISKMVRGVGAGLSTILAEINKCIVLCANCHAVEHWDKRQQGKGYAA